MEFILNFDDRVIHFINDKMRSRSADRFMRLVSAMGDNGAIWLGIAFALIMMGGKKRRAGALMLLSLLAEASVCNLAIKPAVARIRPYDYHGFVINIKKPKDYSFPSGHTAAAFAAAYSMRLSGEKGGRAMMYAAALMGFSRIYLLVHYPMDVFAGAVLGIISASAVHGATHETELLRK